jgi:hypothetical protein
MRAEDFCRSTSLVLENSLCKRVVLYGVTAGAGTTGKRLGARNMQHPGAGIPQVTWIDRVTEY